MCNDKVNLINGNGQPYSLGMPKLLIIGYMNDTALQHIQENTGLNFQAGGWGNTYEAQPENANQIVALFMTYNFKTRMYNNADYHNTIMLKSDHHTGFDVDSICYDCAIENRLGVMNNVKPEERDGFRLAC